MMKRLSNITIDSWKQPVALLLLLGIALTWPLELHSESFKKHSEDSYLFSSDSDPDKQGHPAESDHDSSPIEETEKSEKEESKEENDSDEDSLEIWHSPDLITPYDSQSATSTNASQGSRVHRLPLFIIFHCWKIHLS